MKTTGLPPITRREWLTLLLCGLLLAFAAWFVCASVDQVADGTPSNAPEVQP